VPTVVAASLFQATPALGEAAISEFSMGAGGSVSSIRQTPSNKYDPERLYSLEGPAVMVGITVYQTDRVIARAFGNMVLDIADAAVIRHGLASSLGYHLLGGPLNRVEHHDAATLSSNFSYRLTALLQPAINVYAFPDANSNPPKPLNATVLETSVGFEFMRAFYFDTAIGVQLVGSLKSFYISGDKISIQSFDMIFSWTTSL
jgi:hypothetical protein